MPLDPAIMIAVEQVAYWRAQGLTVPQMYRAVGVRCPAAPTIPGVTLALADAWRVLSAGKKIPVRQGRPAKQRKGTNPIVRHLAKLVQHEGVGDYPIEYRAGLAANTISRWRRGKVEPRLGNIEAALRVLGRELVVRKIQDAA